MSKSEPHPEDVGRKPATVRLISGTAVSKVEVEHADPHEGYLFTIQDGETRIYPWHRVHEVVRDA